MTNFKISHGVASLLFGCVVVFSGCEPSGPAENAGKTIDNDLKSAGDVIKEDAKKAKDAVFPPKGPAQKAGEAIDKAVEPPK